MSYNIKIHKLFIVLFIFQFFIYLLSGVEFRFPNILINRIENKINNKQFVVNIGKCTTNIYGNVTIENILIKRYGTFSPYTLKIKSLCFDVAWIDIFNDKYFPNKIQISDCSMFESITGEFSPAINNISGVCISRKDQLQLNLKGQINNARINLRFSISNDNPLFLFRSYKKIPSTKFNYAKFHIQTLKVSNLVKRISNKSKECLISVILDMDQQQSLIISTELFEYKHNSISIDNCILNLRLNLEKLKLNNFSYNFHISDLSYLIKNHRIDIPHIYTSGIMRIVNDCSYKNTLISSTYIPKITTHGNIVVNISPTIFTSYLNNQFLLSFEGGIFNNDSFIHTKGELNLIKSTLELNVESLLSPSDFNDWFSHNETLNIFSLTKYPIKISSSQNIILHDKKLKEFKFHFISNSFKINNSSLIDVVSTIQYQPESEIFLMDFTGNIGYSQISGLLEQKLDDLKYSCRIRGNFLPTDLSSIMHEWWNKIWKDFSFDSHSPYVDFKIDGAWGGIKSNIAAYGHAELNHVRYKNLSIINGNLHLSVSQQATKLSDISVLLEQGKLNGNLCFSRSKHGEARFLTFDVNGSLNPTDAKSVFGAEAEKILSKFETRSSVNLDAKGHIQLNVNDLEDTNTTNFLIKANTDSQILYSGIVLDSLSVEINSTSGVTKVSPLAFQIADGHGNGSLIFRQEKDITNLEVDIGIKGSDRKRFVQSMQLSETLNNRAEGQINLESNGSDSRGKLDLKLQVSGNPEDFLSFEGNGSILVKDPELGDIRLLGGLTDYLGASKLPLPSGSISFNRLEAPFILNGDALRFGNLSLSGGSTLLVANGVINLSKHVLDLEARLHLLGNVSVPVLGKLIQLLDPLSAVGNIKIDGTFEDPKWSIQLRPGKNALDVLFPNRKHSDKN